MRSIADSGSPDGANRRRAYWVLGSAALSFGCRCNNGRPERRHLIYASEIDATQKAKEAKSTLFLYE